ncbi:DUF5995 family protein [Streptomyces sp. NPDC058653]|uniref:DUF5995 family protein n=1 Tax=Streptomyces sp. NPDC058653 TaxID=3346576 RepID=UPI0036579510
MAETHLLTAPAEPRTAPADDDGRPPDSVWQRMDALRSAWPEGDGLAVFNGLCLSGAGDIEVSYGGGRAATAGTGDAAALRSALAERYLAAVDAVAVGGRAPAAWRPLFRYRRHPRVRPPQFALAGVNAHVGHDLALAVLDLCRARGCEPAALEGAFARVGDALALLVGRVGGPGARLPGPWSLDRALQEAWSSALVLRGVREVPPLAEEFRERMDERVGLVGRRLLTPYG